MQTATCGRLDCQSPATHEVRVPYDGSLVRCNDHVAEAVATYGKFVNRQTDGVRAVPITAGRTDD